jgi:hypothetical protein
VERWSYSPYRLEDGGYNGYTVFNTVEASVLSTTSEHNLASSPTLSTTVEHHSAIAKA